MVVIDAWWEGIGDAVTAEWSRCGNDLSGFTEIAERVLLDHPAPEGPAAGPALDWIASPAFPDQSEPPAGFGQPAVTVYRGDRFMVVLLFWVHESVTIHDHRFVGAFSIVDGASLHSQYDFEPGCRHHADLESGTLTLRHAEILRRGDVRTIAAGTQMIHSNFHFAPEGPGLSILVRSVGPPLATQRFYSRSGLAFTDALHAPTVALRVRGFTAAMAISPEAGRAFLERTLASTTPDAALVYLAAGMVSLGPAAVRPLIERSCLAAYPDVGFRALQYMEQLASAVRVLDHLERATDETSQMLLAAVAAGTPWSGVVHLLGSERAVHRVVRSLAGESLTDDALMTHSVFGGLFRSRV